MKFTIIILTLLASFSAKNGREVGSACSSSDDCGDSSMCCGTAINEVECKTNRCEALREFTKEITICNNKSGPVGHNIGNNHYTSFKCLPAESVGI